MTTKNEKNTTSGNSQSPMAGYDPTDRNFQRNDRETDVSKNENSSGESEEEAMHQKTQKGSSGPEEKDITD